MKSVPFVLGKKRQKEFYFLLKDFKHSDMISRAYVYNVCKNFLNEIIFYGAYYIILSLISFELSANYCLDSDILANKYLYNFSNISRSSNRMVKICMRNNYTLRLRPKF